VIQIPELTGVMMSNLFRMTDEQMERLNLFFPQSHGWLHVDGLRVLTGIICISRNGLRSYDVPRDYGAPKTLYNRCKHGVTWGSLPG
jgi:transposase